jgi:hypothetical protein
MLDKEGQGAKCMVNNMDVTYKVNKRGKKVYYCPSSCHDNDCSSTMEWWASSPTTHLQVAKKKLYQNKRFIIKYAFYFDY